MRTRTTFVSLLCLALMLPSAALAGPTREPEPGGARARPVDAARPATAPAAPDANKAKAKGLFGEGSKQFKVGRFEEAIATFEKAYGFWENPKILVNIAICHQELGRMRQAVITLRKALAKAPPEGRQALRDLLPEALRKADAEAAELHIQMPEEAEVEVGGTPEGKTPATLVLMPGSHEVIIKVGGVEKVKKSIQLGAGAKEDWTLAAWPAAEAPPGMTPAPKGPGFWARMRRLQTLPIWYFGAAAALAVVGGITIVGAGVKTNQLEDDYWADPTHATRNEGIRYRSATNAMVGITVTALVSAAVLALFTDWKNPFKKGKERQVEIVPQVGDSGAGLVVSGGF